MEKPRHRRSRSLSGLEGNQLVQKQRVTRKLTSDSSSYNYGTAKGDMYMLESVKNSSRQVTGAPIKKLLADDMKKDVEAKRRSPSVVARLMGLDGLPSPQRGHKQQTTLSDNHHQRIALLAVQRDSHLLDGRSRRRSSMEHQEFKDVHEDLEASHVLNHRHSSKWSSNSKLKKPELSVIQQKIADAQRFPANEKPRASPEFSDTLDSVYPNSELLQKSLRQPHSMFVKHVNDLNLDPSSNLHNHIAILKPAKSDKCESNAKAWKSEQDYVSKHDVRTHRKRKDGLLLHSITDHSAPRTLKSSGTQLKETGTKQNLPTQIVVLKPGKTSKSKSSLLSPDSSHTSKCTQLPSPEAVEAALSENRGSSNFGGLSRLNCREAREVAKKITRQMKENFGAFKSGPLNLAYSKVRGYAGDESSYDAYDSDSDSSSDVMVASRKSFGWNARARSPSDSTMNREAKKRLSERWKITHRYQGEEICDKGNTLGEMLAISDRERKPKHLDSARSWDVDGGEFASNDIYAVWNGPLGISSSDGWKDGCVEKPSKSRSLSPSVRGKSQKTSEQLDTFLDGQHLLTGATISKGCCVAVKEGLSLNEDSLAIEFRSGGKRHHSSQDKFLVNADSLPQTVFSQTETDIRSEKVNPFKEHPLTFPNPRASMELLPDISASMNNSGDSSACDHEYSVLQEASKIILEESSANSQRPAPEPESSESSKEAEHPSPVSVLELAFTKDTSSGPECFKRVSAGLQELRAQLKLLKMESEEDADESVLVANVEDMLLETEDKHMLTSESWEDSYIIDILIESGFNELHLDMFSTGCQSVECPLVASVFDNLEKKYSAETTGLRSERRRLFDRVNSALTMMFQQYFDKCPWVKPAKQIVDSDWQNRGLKDALYKLLGGEEKKASCTRPERMVDKEMEWSDYRDSIDMIGKEIEKLLTDELIMELVTM